MKRLFSYFSFFISISFLGCSVAPSLRVSQPWVRSLQSEISIDPAKSVNIIVDGDTAPLLGSESLLSGKLRNILSSLITRRGFVISDEHYDYLINMTYNTIANDNTSYSSMSSSLNTQWIAISTNSGVGLTSGLGVSIARAVGSIASRSVTSSTNSIAQVSYYTHTVSIEFSTTEGTILWKGESTWDSNRLNILNQITPALQLILSDLPSNAIIRPEIPEVKTTHVENYYLLKCDGVWFTCPALPFRILFSAIGYSRSGYTTIVPDYIDDQYALAAYVDLIQTAEYALPNGNERSWKNPLRISLWRKVTLGGQYYLGPKKKPVNILIKLTGKPDGYYVTECKVATNEEFNKYKIKYSKWRKMLNDYYDVYQQ